MKWLCGDWRQVLGQYEQRLKALCKQDQRDERLQHDFLYVEHT